MGVLLASDALGGRFAASDGAFALGTILLQLTSSVSGGLAGRSIVLRGRIPDPGAMPPEA